MTSPSGENFPYFGYDHGEDELIEKEMASPKRRIWPWLALLIVGILFFRSCEPAWQAAWYSKNDPTDLKPHILTASGERFDENGLTAASWRYPFGTRLKVTNRNNGKSIVVRVNDRGPAQWLYAKGRILDLSKSAFQSLAALSEGVIPVKVEVLR